MGKEYIVTISEGANTEKQLINNIERIFFNDDKDKELIILSFKTNIYALYKVMKEDKFETDIIEVLIEKEPSLNSILKSDVKKSISEIYLFFDYDGHAYKRDKVDDIISKMIELFDNETEYGKLYISYPMVESIKDLQKVDTCFRRCFVPGKENIHYKSLVAKVTDFCDLRNITLEEWYLILAHNIKKAKCIVSAQFIIPIYSDYRETIDQITIFQNQLKNYIAMNDRIAVISGFPLFLIDYFGETLYNVIVDRHFI